MSSLLEPDDPRRFGGRVDTSAREAAQHAAAGWISDYLDGDLEACLEVPLSPDCAAGKCHACSGDSWSVNLDESRPCPHTCHVLERPAGEADPGW